MSEAIETNKLFVGNLARTVKWQELKEFFGQWGEVAYASVSLDRETRKSRGFGFVTFVNAEDAVKAKTASEGTTLHERELYVDFARARPTQEENTEEETQQEQLEENQENEENNEE